MCRMTRKYKKSNHKQYQQHGSFQSGFYDLVSIIKQNNLADLFTCSKEWQRETSKILNQIQISFFL